jgi:hypothetical protein
MFVSELISRAHEFIGREISVDGILVVGDCTRLVTDAGNLHDAGVHLPHAAVRASLLQAVPPWGGGRHIYAEQATVVGMLTGAPLRFSTVRSLTVRRDDETYEFTDIA